MKIVVTGACGLIGKKIAIHLSKDHEVYGVGRSLCVELDNSLTFSYFVIDLSADSAIKELQKVIPLGVDLIIHCAAQQPRSGLLFKDYRKGNIDTTENIVEWAKNSKVKSLITFSTLALLDFPIDEYSFLTEKTVAYPKNYYSLSKWISEVYLNLEANNSHLTILCFRIPSLVHEKQQGGIVNTYWNYAKKNQDLDVYDKGKFRRNLIYIDSILELIDIMLTSHHNFNGFNLYNVGSEDAWTLLEIAQYIYKKMDATANIVLKDRPSKIPGHCSINNSKAKDEFEFLPWTTKKVLDTYMENMDGEAVEL